MLKYKPTNENNNKLKNEIVRKLNFFLNDLEKARFNNALDKDVVENIKSQLKYDIENVEGTFFSGNEDILNIYNHIMEAIDKTKKASENMLNSSFIDEAGELSYWLQLWRDVASGEIVDGNADMAREKMSFKMKSITKRLDQLEEIKNKYNSHQNRIEADIAKLERECGELDERMLVVLENDREYNYLFQQYASKQQQVKDLNIRRENYTYCFGMFERIFTNISELITEGEYAKAQLYRASGLLNIEKLEKTINDPSVARNILKRFDEELEKIKERVRTNTEQLTIGTGMSEAAEKHREELLKRQREKATLDAMNKEIDKKQKNGATTQEEMAQDEKIDRDDKK